MRNLFLLLALLVGSTALSLTESINAQADVAPCQIAFAPLFQVRNDLVLPEVPAASFDPEAEQVVDDYLLRYSTDYLAAHYDPLTGMVRPEAEKLAVRATMISAFVWAETGQMQQALVALNTVLSYQVLDASNPQFGNFLVYSDDTEPTDNNWSAFIGSYLIVFYERYPNAIPDETKAAILQAVSAAATHRLCQRYANNNNISFLSSFLLLTAGRLSGNPVFTDAGWALWNRITTFTVDGGFGEYSSTNYYKVDLYALGFMTDYSDIPALITEARYIRDLLWWTITQHYHAPTGSLAGPYSRSIADRAVYELSGLQAFLYRDSLGRIPLPLYEGYADNEQALHTILPRLVHSSWREDWVAIATEASVVPHQVREQVWLPSSNHEITQQITTYLGPHLSLGSVSADLPTGQGRFLIAQAVDLTGENVGLFRLMMPSAPGYANSILKFTQNRTSVLGVVQLNYAAAQPLPPPLDLRFQWFGTEQNLPQAITTEPATFNSQVNVQWMDTLVSLRLTDLLSTDGTSSQFALTSRQADAQLELTQQFQLSSPPAEDNRGLLTPVIFCLYIDEEGVEQIALEPPTVVVGEAGEGYRTIRWQSPDGLLEMELPQSAKELWFMKEWLNGEPIQRSRLAATLPIAG